MNWSISVVIFALLAISISHVRGQTILEEAQARNLTTLVDALQWQNLTSEFNGSNLTVFGPTDAAFALVSNLTGLNETGALAGILRYHALNGVYDTTNLTNDLVLQNTLEPNSWVRVNVYPTGTFINGLSKVVVPNTNATNGVLHIVDQVLIPPTDENRRNLTLDVVIQNQFQYFYDLLNISGELSLFNSSDLQSPAFTIFAPTNDAFANIPPQVMNTLLLPKNKELLSTLLKYHVLNGTYFSTAFASNTTTPLTTLEGSSVSVTASSDGNVTVKGANVIIANLQGRTGVVHGIDNIIIPDNFVFPINSVLDVAFEQGLDTVVDAISWQNLTDLFNDNQTTTNFTLFAPTNEAFENLPPGVLQQLNTTGELADVLKYHTLPGIVTINDLKNDQVLNNTLFPDSFIRVNKYTTGTFLNGLANVTDVDYAADNGMVHKIDHVLMWDPSSNMTIAEVLTLPQFSSLYNALNSTNLLSVFQNPLFESQPYTLFAPTNDAFAVIPQNIMTLLLNVSNGLLERILNYHYVDGIYFSVAFPDGTTTNLTTKEGSKIGVMSLSKGVLFVDEANVTLADRICRNGVIHVINSVLAPSDVTFPGNNIMDEAWTRELSEFVSYLTWQNLAPTFSGNGSDANYTIFAPTNEAFNAIPNIETLNSTGELAEILQYHALPGRINIDLKSINNSIFNDTLLPDTWIRVNVYPNGVFLNGLTSLSSATLNIDATNGVLHIINDVLVPPTDANGNNRTLSQRLQTDGNYSTLHTALALTGLLDTFTSLEFFPTYTIFAPTNDAFSALPGSLLSNLLLPVNNDTLRQLLLFHVLPNDLYTTAFDKNAPYLTLGGETVNITINGGIKVDGVPVTRANIQARNGVIHSIGQILIPDNLPIPVGSNIVDVLVVEELNTLVEALEWQSLVEEFNGTTNHTLFAPTNAAFASLNQTILDEFNSTGELAAILKYHAILDSINSTQFVNDLAYTTLNGEWIRVNVYSEKVYLNGITEVTRADIQATNGIVHIIDEVLFPPNFENGRNLTLWEGILVHAADFGLTRLVDAITAANLTERFNNVSLDTSNLFTIFAPNNDAFDALPPGVLSALLRPENVNVLTQLLFTHVVPGGHFTTEFVAGSTTHLSNYDNTLLNVTNNNGVITVNNAGVTNSNSQFRNGVLHTISKVLLPPVISNSIVGMANSQGLSTFLSVLDWLNITSNFLFETGTPVTVFAPNNAAFEAINLKQLNDTPAVLSNLMKNHMFNGRFFSDDIKNDEIINSTASEPNWIRTNVYTTGKFLNGIPVLASNLNGTDGVLHVVSGVIFPPDSSNQHGSLLSARLQNYTKLYSALNQTNLLSTFEVALFNPSYTIFAPTDDAINGLAPGVWDALQTSDNSDSFKSLLLYHVVPNTYFSTAFPSGESQLTTMSSNYNITVTVDQSGVKVNGVSASKFNQQSMNGVIHELSNVITPPGFNYPNVVDNTPIIIGASIGGAALLVLIIIGVVCWRKRRHGYEPVKS